MTQPISPQSKAPEPANPVNHEWVRNVIDACTSGNSHGNHAGDQVLCHRVAFQINKHFGLENRRWNTDGDPERDADFIDPYPHGDYFEEVKRHHAGAALSSPSPAPPTFHMYVWTNPSFFHAVAQATSVAEARELLLEEIGSGDGSCPERGHAAKLVRELQPSIFHRSNAEFCLTDSAELREQEAYTKTLQDKIAELMKISPSPAMHDTMDAAIWAKEFKRICDEKGLFCDEGWMLGWFANAIMVGWDFAKRESHTLGDKTDETRKEK